MLMSLANGSQALHRDSLYGLSASADSSLEEEQQAKDRLQCEAEREKSSEEGATLETQWQLCGKST